MTTEELDFSKPEYLQTVDGRNVRIFCTDGSKPFEVLGAVEYPEWCMPMAWTKQGKVREASSSHLNLVRKTRRVTGWLNVYKRGDGPLCFGADLHSSIETSMAASGGRAFGRIYIDAELQHHDL